ncbi:MAG: ATP-dependent Clp protease adapter ClpS [Planctomycetota bacterium]
MLPAFGSTTTKTIPVEETDTRTRLDRPWSVIVWDDPINLMSYVVYVFQKLFGFSEQVATIKMLEVHEQGRSLVVTVDREKAEYYVSRLHLYGLKATMEKASG